VEDFCILVPQPLGCQLASRLLVLGSEIDLIRGMKSDPTLVFPNLGCPMTVEWLFSTVAQSTGVCSASRDHRWIRESGIGVTDQSTFEHQVLSKVLQSAIDVDLVNVLNKMSMELCCRRNPLIEEVYAEDPQQLSWEEAVSFMRFGKRRGPALLVLSLRSPAAGRLAADSVFQKGKRNARESRKGEGNGKKKDMAEE
jgi:hypothetical protein